MRAIHEPSGTSATGHGRISTVCIINRTAAKHMLAKIYDQHGIEIFEEDSRFFVRYDAGAHVVALRLDEISKDDADVAMIGPAAAERVLLSLQKRLQATGIDPYKTNV